MSIQRLGIAVLITLLVIFGIYRFGFDEGWTKRDVEMQAEIARKNEEARQTEQRLSDQINTHATKLEEVNHALDQKSSALDRAIRTGRVRLPTASCSQASVNPASPPGDRDKAPSQPDPATDGPSDSERETLQLIAQIAADGDRAINQLNACIDAYEEVRRTANANR